MRKYITKTQDDWYVYVIWSNSKFFIFNCLLTHHWFLHFRRSIIAPLSWFYVDKIYVGNGWNRSIISIKFDPHRNTRTCTRTDTQSHALVPMHTEIHVHAQTHAHANTHTHILWMSVLFLWCDIRLEHRERCLTRINMLKYPFHLLDLEVLFRNNIIRNRNNNKERRASR